MRNQLNPRAKLHDIWLWTNWFECSSRRLGFPKPPMDLLVLYVVQSIEQAHCLAASAGLSVQEEIVESHIRAYLLEKVWSYHSTVQLVREDACACSSWIALSGRKRVLSATRKVVADLFLSQNRPSKLGFRLAARQAILITLSRSRSRGRAVRVAEPDRRANLPSVRI
jgi:hypothetical protein